ncbi:hypothetical protein [Actinoplanes sp. URMC 104]|uniref:hypothetical protein n=1 Tax=Actinoplanes sp. URMC 104 TaxID=3423409 RepID=UPI003F1B7305
MLRLEAVAPASPNVPLGDAGPDDIILSLGTEQLARLDGRYLSTEVASGFTGRMLALSAPTVAVHVRSVQYRPRDE